MRCPQCSEEADPGHTRCRSCGAALGDAVTSLGPRDDDGPSSGVPVDDAMTSAGPPEDARTSAGPPDDATTSAGPLDEAATSADPVGEGPGAGPTPGSSPGGSGPGSSQGARPSHGTGSREPGADAGEHGRFLPGATVAGRYRIVGLLGRGGMGEVYRADDLKLGQPVALKFLTGHLADDPDQVELLLDEVRMARKVSHPNVCRVWDIGEAEGLHYVSMEYVDGEDLASLLRRIGRLPRDKAVEIARQLCAALAAAHDEGVLHRDLKPANIMLDGRGRVKLTDFGLAGVAEVRAGTPVYMAPEQLAGREVSVKSDLFSLGLVLHELFTGKRVFEADGIEELTRSHREGLTTSLASVSELDPAVDRIIQRCLEVDPDQRPASAIAVAAGLPGADPLAAALAAGETPSPEMVAEAGGEGSLPVAIAVPLLLVALVGAVAVGVLQARVSLVSQVPFDTPPAVLDARAREIVEELGYDTDFTDRASAFGQDLRYILWLRQQEALQERWDAVRSGRPASIVYWWRGSPETLVPRVRTNPSSTVSVSLDNPPRTTPGMVSLRLDTTGRLLWFDAVPERVHRGSPEGRANGGETGSGAGEATPDGTGPAERDPVLDWPGLFELMGLEIADFTAVEPRLRPPHFADRRTAWQGVYPEDPETSLRIEVAHLDGRLVSLRGFASYDPVPSPPGGSTSQDTGSGGSTSQDTGNGASASQDTGNGGSTSQDTGNGASEDPGPSVSLATIVTILVLVTIVASILTAIFGAVWVARRNVASGRGDARGARRVGTLIAAAIGIEWLLGEHTFSFSDINAFLEMLIFVGAFGGLAWALYLAVEPFMRRNAPRALIGWTRLVDGRLSDPLVGRDLLLGCAAGAVSRLLAVIPMVLAEPGETAVNYVGLPFPSLGRMLGGLVGSTAQSIVVGLALLFLFGLTFVALRRRWWAAYALWVGFAAAMAFLPGLTVNNVMPAATRSTSIFWILGSALVLFVLFRLGILAYVAAAATSWLLASSLPTLDFTAWYAQTSIAALVILAGLAAYAFHRCVVWRGRLAEALAGG